MRSIAQRCVWPLTWIPYKFHTLPFPNGRIAAQATSDKWYITHCFTLCLLMHNCEAGRLVRTWKPLRRKPPGVPSLPLRHYDWPTVSIGVRDGIPYGQAGSCAMPQYHANGVDRVAELRSSWDYRWLFSRNPPARFAWLNRGSTLEKGPGLSTPSTGGTTKSVVGHNDVRAAACATPDRMWTGPARSRQKRLRRWGNPSTW